MVKVDEEKWYWIWLMSVAGVGPATFWRLKKEFGSVESVFGAGKKALGRLEIKGGRLDGLIRSRTDFDRERYLKSMAELGFSPLFADENRYPGRLLEVPNPPPILWIYGKSEWLSTYPQVCVVGTRDISSYGREVTEQFVAAFALAGVTIVSGLAFGVDTCAHISALECQDGRTIGVLGGGLAIVLNHRHDEGFERVKSEALLVSQFDPFSGASKATFPQRNSTMAAMANAVVITQAGLDSGALITAGYASRYNRPVFVVPGDIDNDRSRGCNQLIGSGKAKLVVDASEVLKVVFPSFGFARVESSGRPKKTEVKGQGKVVETVEAKLLAALRGGSGHALDELVAKVSGIDTGEILSELGLLELSGKVKSTGGKYKLAR